MENIEEYYKELYQGMIHKDKKRLEKLLDDHFILCHISGLKQNKYEFIEAILDGTLNYYSVDHVKINARVKDNSAFLEGYTNVEASVFGGQRRIWPLLLKLEMVNENGQWLFRSARAFTF